MKKQQRSELRAHQSSPESMPVQLRQDAQHVPRRPIQLVENVQQTGEQARGGDSAQHTGPFLPIQLVRSPKSIQTVAAEGVSGASQQLPHLNAIQSSFGTHDVSQIQAYIGGSSSQANASLGSQAYATGNQVAFKSSPSLHTAAHEAAHVVQQRGGVQLEGGVGQVGDSYEKNADAVADRVVQGRAATDLLGPTSSGSGGQGVQKIQFWGKQHETLTTDAAIRWNAANPGRKITPGQLTKLIEGSDDPDYSGRLNNLAGLKAVALTVTNTGRIPGQTVQGEGVNHGEGLNYTVVGQAANASVNKSAVCTKIDEAVTAINPADGSMNAMALVGFAMHMAQDRGSHDEGAKGEGHDTGSILAATHPEQIKADPKKLSKNLSYNKETGQLDSGGEPGQHNTDDDGDNSEGFARSSGLSDEVVAEFFSKVGGKDLGGDRAKIESSPSILSGVGKEKWDARSDIIDFDESDEQSSITLEAYMKQGKLDALSASEIAQYMVPLLEGNCVDEEEEVVNRALAAVGTSKMESIVSALGGGSVKKGVNKLDSGIDGEQWVECMQILQASDACSEQLSFGDTDELAAEVLRTHLEKNTIMGLSKAQLVKYIKDLVEGNCGDDEEKLINRTLEAIGVALMEAVVIDLGGGSAEDGVDKLDSGIDGSEWTQCKRILAYSDACKPYVT